MKGVIIPYYPTTAHPPSQQLPLLIELARKYPSVPVVLAYDTYQSATREQQMSAYFPIFKSVGIKRVGYVFTGTGNPSMATLQGNVDYWYSFDADIDGIFFDEYTWNTFGASGYSQLCQYTRNKGANTIVGNPGTYCSQAYFDNYPNSPDIMTIAEKNGIANVNISAINAAAGTSSRKGAIPYNITSAEVSDSFFNSLVNVVGWVYFLNDISQGWSIISNWLDRQMNLLSSPVWNNPVDYNYSVSAGGVCIKSKNAATNDTALRIKSGSTTLGLQLQDVTNDAAGAIRVHFDNQVKSIKRL